MTEPTATPAGQPERKPWHAPTLTEVELTLTGLASGANSDSGASTDRTPS